MFNNIGRKIKTLAKVLCWIGCIFAIIIGISMMVSGGNSSYISMNGTPVSVGSSASVIMGIIVIILGVLASWIGSFAMYGFGQLVENSDKLVEKAGKNA